MKFTSTPASLESTSRGAPIRLLSRLFLFALLSAFALPPAFAQYRTYPIYTNVSSVPAGSYGTTIVASVDDSSITANFKVCFDTGYGSSKVPIVPYAYVSYGDFAQFNFDVPPSTIQAVPPSAFASGSFNVSIYSVPTTFTACNGNEGGASQGNTVTLNYPVLSTVSLPDLPEQNVALTSREPSSLSLTGQNFIGNSGTNGKVPSAVNFISSTTLAGTVKYLTGYSLRSTIPTTIPAAATSVNIQVCNTAIYSYCSNSLTLKTAALQQNSGTLTASPSPALTTQPVTLTASFGPARHSVAGAPSGPVTFGDWGTTLGTANLVLDKTATFAQAPTQQFLVYASPLVPIVADFNGDGIPDTLLIDPGNINNGGSSLNLLLGTVPSGSFQANQQFYILSDGPSFTISSAAVGDFNGDGIPDIVLLAAEPDYNTGLALYTMLGNGDGTFQDGFSSSPTLFGSQIVAGDFNKDGKLDIVIAGALDANGTIGLQTLPGDGTGNFTGGPATTGLRTEPSPYFGDFKVAAADFNADGYPDIAVMNGYSPSGQLDNSIEVYQNNGKGVFLAPVRVATDGTPTANFSIAALGPGLPLDIIVTSTASSIPGIDVALNQSTTAKIAFFGTFEDTEVPGITQAVTGDFDGDGLLDVAVDDGKTIHVLSGNGFGAFTATYPDLSIVPPGTTLIAGSDENGDKYADLLLYTTGTQNSNNEYPITVYDYITSGTATATFPPVSFAAGSHPLHASTNGTFDILAGSATATLIVTAPAASTVTLTASPTSPANYGVAKITLTATIPVANVTGSVSFYNGTTLLGTGPLVDATSSTATFIVATPVAGTYSFKAVYGGDTTHGGGTSAVLPYVVNPIAATISWTPNPSTIVYGTALSAAQLNATATSVTGAPVAGSFTYAPALGTILTAGTHSVVATFTPTNTNYAVTTATRNITVTQATPVITWLPNPATITYGTPLSAAQLDAASTTPGTFTYAPALGTVLTAGIQTLSTTFTPKDATDFTSVTKTATITVAAASSVTTLAITSGGTAAATVASGSVVTLTATVTMAGKPVTPGQVNFCDATSVYCTDIYLLGTAQLTPTGTASLKFIPGIGSHSYKAVFLGTGNDSASTSTPSELAVTGLYPTTTTIAQSGSTGDYTLTATTTSTNGANVAPTGTISFLDQSNGSSVLANAPFGSGTGEYELPVSADTPVGAVPDRAGVGDINGDGKPDIVIPNPYLNNFSVLLGNGDGTFTTAPNASAQAPTRPVLADFNGDGIVDLAAATATGVSILLGKGDGTFSTPLVTPVAGLDSTYPDTVSSGDFNGDGILDLALTFDASETSTSTNGIALFLGNGDGTFRAAATLTLAETPLGAVLGDFDSDGNLDMAVPVRGAVHIYLGNGDGTFHQGTDTALGVGYPYAMAAADLNEDGKLDLIVPDAGAGQTPNGSLILLLGNGDGTFTATASPAVGKSPSGVVVADFNADGNPDIATVNHGDNTVSVLLGKGDGTFTLLASPATDLLPTHLSAADFNGDGRSDLAAVNYIVESSTVNGTATVFLTELKQTATATATGVSPLGAGLHQVIASYPGDTNYGTSTSAATALNGAQLTPTITWVPSVSTITYGTALGSQQLDAVATGANGVAVPGTFTYTPAAGAILSAGTQILKVVFTPTSSIYSVATAQAAITVTQATPVITWLPDPSTITYGTPLSAAQLDATSTIPGTFFYTPALGALLNTGTHTLSVAFTPTDTNDFTPASKTVTITVDASGLTLSATSLQFGDQPYGTTSPAQTVTVTNPGTSAIAIYSIDSTLGLDPQDFLATSNCPASLAPSTTCQISVTFTPAGVGARSAGIAITDNSTPSSQTINVSGTGTGCILQVNPGDLQTIAGNGTAGYAGDHNPAMTAELNLPDGIAFDPAGNFYIADTSNNVIRKVDTAGTITTFAGNGTAGYMGDNEAATSAELNQPYSVVSDSVGNIYIEDTHNYVIRKVSAYGIITTIAGTGVKGHGGDGNPATSATFSDPQGARFDSLGNLYIADCVAASVRKIDTKGIVTTVAGNFIAGYNGDGIPATTAELSCPSGVAFDAAGNFYIADYGNSRIRKVDTNGIISTIAGTGTSGATGDGGPATAATFNLPNDVVFDPIGNLYIADSGNNRIRKIDTSGIVTTAAGGFNSAGSAAVNSPSALAIDKAGNVYFSDSGNSAIREIVPQSTSSFPATVIGTAAAPQTLTLSNIGNVPIAIPASGSFTLSGNASDFSLTGGTCLNGATLAANESTCTLQISFTPTAIGARTLRVSIADNALNSPQSFTIGGIGTAAVPALTWTPPASITYGMPLSAAQLDASATGLAGAAVAGTYTYTPAAGTVLTAGTHSLSVVFTSSNPNYSGATAAVPITVTQAVPAVTWTPTPSTIAYGTPLSTTQLDATSTTSGTFTYTPALGAVLPAGTQTLSVLFTPTDTVDFTSVTKTVTIIVSAASPAVVWLPNPAAVTYGTPLSAAQLDATSTTPGTFTYTPAIGAVLTAGTQTLSVLFTPTNTTDFKPLTATTTITVAQAKPVLSWTTPAAIVSGTPLSTIQLDATVVGVNGVALSGNFNYTPPAGTVLPAGTSTLSVLFTPTDSVDYTPATGTVVQSVTVPATTTTLTSSLAQSVFGQPVLFTAVTSSTQPVTGKVNFYDGSTLIGSSSVSSGSPATLTLSTLAAGRHSISVAFVASSSFGGSTSVPLALTVSPTPTTVAWTPNPATIGYGTPLTTAQLDATASTTYATTVPGTFVYTPVLGTVLPAGPQTLQVAFTPTDTLNFLASTGTTQITVTGGTPVIVWVPNPATITYGTPLSAAQLDATSSTPGTFTYTPPLGTVLTAGTQTLSVLFTPNDTTHYKSVTTTVPITVTQATPAVTWTPNPVTVPYGTPLSAAQLDATSTTTGAFTYTPALGTVLTAGTQTLSAIFTPKDTTDFKSVTATVNIVVTPVSPTVTWTPNPATIGYGTPLSAAQLDATSSTPGTFAYTPALGTVLALGTQTLSVTFTPTDATDFKPATATATITVTAGTPTVTWTPNPATITYGTGLTAAQLDATAATPGTFIYNPGLGTILPVGTQTLSVLFTPTDSKDFKPVSTTATITVTTAVPSVTWTPSPATITYGTALTAAQLDATATIPGTFSYNPALGTVLPAGTQTLSTLFTPTDSKDFKSVSTTTTITVNQATPAVTWTPVPTTITYGTALSAAQLDATSTTPGTFSYNPALGTVLTAGTQTLSVSFTPTDPKNFKSVITTATITVSQATPTISWAAPASIVVGTALSSTQLDATATAPNGAALPGTFVYMPAAGTLLTAGTQTLKVAFTPTDLADYATAAASVSLQVIPVTLTALSTSTAALGDPAKTITLTGTGFVPSASVLVNGSGIPTTFVNPTTLTAVMPAADFLMTQILEISVTEPTQNQTTASLPFLVGAPPADAVFTGPSVIFSGTQTGLTFQLPKSYPVDLTATFTLNFTPATGLPNDPTVVFASGGNTFVANIPANSTTVPSVQIQSGTVAGTISVALALEADGVNVTPASIQPLTIQAPLAVPGLTSAALTRNGNTLTVAVRGFSNPRDMTSARFHFTPVPGGSIGNEDVTIDVVPIFTTWYADPASSQYGSSFTYTQIFNLSSDASVVGQVSVTLVNSVGDSMGANTP